jgi:intracellular septation protein A
MKGLGHTVRYFATDVASMILFFVVFLTTGNIYLATGVGIAFGVLQVAWGLVRRQPIGMLQWTSLGLIVVFGGATLVTHDARFVMFKPTVVHGVIGATMLKTGWMERYAPPEVREIARPLMNRFGYVWAGLMFFIAALNLVSMFAFDAATWARINLFADPVLIGALFVVQNLYMRSKAALAHYDMAKGAPPPIN